MCAVVHASAYVEKLKLSGSANGRPRKISVLLLNEASTTQISGLAVASAQRKSEMWATAPSGLTLGSAAGLRPAARALAVGVTAIASAPGLLVTFVIVSPLWRIRLRRRRGE